MVKERGKKNPTKQEEASLPINELEDRKVVAESLVFLVQTLKKFGQDQGTKKGKKK